MVQTFPPKPGLATSPSTCHPTGSSWDLGLVIGYWQKPFLGSHVPITVTIYSNAHLLFFQKNLISMCTVRLPQYYCIDLLEWERIWLEWTAESNAILQLCASRDKAHMQKRQKNLWAGDRQETISTPHLLQHTLVWSPYDPPSPLASGSWILQERHLY